MPASSSTPTRRPGCSSPPSTFPATARRALDPHSRIVDVSKTWQPDELDPFAELIAGAHIPVVMVGHLIHPRFSDGDRPASLSRRAITAELRGRLGFTGLVITDDLGMDAIAERFAPEEAAEMAARAGADLLIFANQPASDPAFVARITSALAGAVAAGRVPKSTIDASYARIRAVRAALARRPPLPAALPEACSEPESPERAAAGRAAVTPARAPAKGLP